MPTATHLYAHLCVDHTATHTTVAAVLYDGKRERTVYRCTVKRCTEPKAEKLMVKKLDMLLTDDYTTLPPRFSKRDAVRWLSRKAMTGTAITLTGAKRDAALRRLQRTTDALLTSRITWSPEYADLVDAAASGLRAIRLTRPSR